MMKASISSLFRRDGSVRSVLDLVVTVAMLLAAGLIIRNNLQQAPAPRGPSVPQGPIAIADSPGLGEEKAPVLLLIYSDFECPYCAELVRNTLPNIEERYVRPGKVRLVFRHMPNAQKHPHAMRAAVAAECAGEQGAFFAYHDLLFSDQQHLDEGSLAARAEAAHLDSSQFSACVEKDASKARITRDLASAKDLRVSATPTMFIGSLDIQGQGRMSAVLSGAVSADKLGALLDKALEERGSRPSDLVMELVIGISVFTAGMTAWIWRRRRRRASVSAAPA